MRGMRHRPKKCILVALFTAAQEARKVIPALLDAGAGLLERMIPRATEITEIIFGALNAVKRVALPYMLPRMLEDEMDEA